MRSVPTTRRHPAGTGTTPLMSSRRARAPARRARIDRITAFFAVLAATSAGGVWALHGGAALLGTLGGAGVLLLRIAPVIVAALFIGGYVQALLPRDLVARWLGGDSGAGAYLLAMTAGALTPAGPFAAFPLVLALWRAGARFDVCVVYLTAWATLGVQRVVIWELPFLGADFVALRLAVSLPLPLAAGLLARTLPGVRR